MSTQPESARVSEKMRQLNEFRHEYSDETANELVREWLKELEAKQSRVQYLEARIEQLSLESGHLHIKDYGRWMIIREWSESVIRGAAETPVVNQSDDTGQNTSSCE